jgi:succinate dehydrogenase/fumarate reductase flavoprotein subunit
MPERGLYDKDAAAVYLSTSARRIDELRRAGDLVAAVDGREYKYRRRDLDAYCDGLKDFEPGQVAS